MGRWLDIYHARSHAHYHARSRTISARTTRYTASTGARGCLGPSQQPSRDYLFNGGLPLIQLRHAHHARSSRGGRRGERGVARLPRRVTARMHRACLNNSCLQWLASKCSLPARCPWVAGLQWCPWVQPIMQLTCSGVAAFLLCFQFLFRDVLQAAVRRCCSGACL